MSEQITLVNSNDEIIGFMDKVEAHLGDGERHQAISVFLFNSKGELLIQQRSKEKIVGALQWANTCCGNVLEGETREECAYRRLSQELGITDVKLKSIGKFEYHIRCNGKYSEWEIDEVYIGQYDGNVFPNPLEVNDHKWVDPIKFFSQVRSGNTKTITPWVMEILKHTQIENLSKSSAKIAS